MNILINYVGTDIKYWPNELCSTFNLSIFPKAWYLFEMTNLLTIPVLYSLYSFSFNQKFKLQVDVVFRMANGD